MIVRILGVLVGGVLIWAGCVGLFDSSVEVDAIGSLAMGVAFVAYGLLGQSGLARLFPAYAEKNRGKKRPTVESPPAPAPATGRDRRVASK